MFLTLNQCDLSSWCKNCSYLHHYIQFISFVRVFSVPRSISFSAKKTKRNLACNFVWMAIIWFWCGCCWIIISIYCFCVCYLAWWNGRHNLNAIDKPECTRRYSTEEKKKEHSEISSHNIKNGISILTEPREKKQQTNCVSSSLAAIVFKWIIYAKINISRK